MEVRVASHTYHGNDTLTYTHHSPLAIGQIVIVPLRATKVLGVVVRLSKRPSYSVKPIIEATDLPALPAPHLQLMMWLKAFYPAPWGIIAQQFMPRTLPMKPLKTPPPTPTPPTALPNLTAEQVQAVDAIGTAGTYLLHGDTGSGKTRVYIEIVRRALEAGTSSLVLTPEIGLTPQLSADFKKAFGNKNIIVFHSQLSEATKRKVWLQVLGCQSPVIVIGARSALFLPIKQLGAIIVDESHETAYKQDQAPHYHASRVAAFLARTHKAPLILGSATPLVSDYFMAKVRQRPILRMQQTALPTSADAKKIRLVDLRDRTLFTKRSHLSDILLQAIDTTLQRGEQILLFLNRRGTARVVLCERCGWQADCPNCDTPLIYHGDTHTLRCHSCNYTLHPPSSCPSCGHTTVLFKSIGTKAIVDEVSRFFPNARVQRFDTDNKKTERIEQHYDALKSGDIDIVVGTQTLVKGLDLPQLSLVGVVMADTSLSFPDYTAEERTYQLLSQVIGRVGRGHTSGTVIIQTYNPQGALLNAIISKNWEAFYAHEITERRAFHFPPFCYILKLMCRRATSNRAQQTAETLSAVIAEKHPHITIDGPAPAFREKVQGKYQWQLILKASNRSMLLAVIDMLPSGWTYDIDPMDLL